MLEKPAYSVDYTLTITLRPKCYIHEPERQYDDTYEYLKKKLTGLTQAFTLIAELTKSYNIHYHAVIKFPITSKNVLKNFYKQFRNDPLIGFIKIEQMINEHKWREYISKDLSHTLDAINRRSIIYDYYDWFDEEQRALYGITW